MRPRYRAAGRNANDPGQAENPPSSANRHHEGHIMVDRKNRYGRTAARIHDADGLARRPPSPTIDIHAHIVVPQASAHAQPHVDVSRIPLAHFADAATKEINAQQESDIRDVMTTIDRRLSDLDRMGIDIQVVAPAPNQCYYSIDPKIAEQAHRLANDGVAEFCSRRADRFVGLGVVTLQEPEIATRELDYVIGTLKLKGVEILTTVDGQELSDPKFRTFFARAEQLGAFIMMHPNGFTHGERLTHFYFNNVLGNPLDTTLALHNLVFSGTLARFPELKLMAVHGGGYLPSYSGRIDHAWGARRDSHADLPLPPTTYLRQVYLDTVVFTYHQLAYLIEVFGPDRIVMGTDYPFDMAEYNPIGHVAGVKGMNERILAQITGGNAARVLGLAL
jgi:aminocarboxymuconate-semialdehyde decarboxylase